ncbi:MAG: DUF3224 domain-containing protein [Gammaproteobacteria bacterium]|nr:DUF3224 domain-containing protein [Gammaproteobacteria bacterium]
MKKTEATSERAAGSFDVKVTPQKPDTQIARAAGVGRLTIDKRFHGDLEGTGKGEMLASQSDVPGSAGYVAMERVSGTLKGRSGGFILQHSATMTRGAPVSSIMVVPDSGTGELRGISGRMTVTVGAEGGHSYEFEFTFEP